LADGKSANAESLLHEVMINNAMKNTPNKGSDAFNFIELFWCSC